jgi:hypothetical protein
MRWLAVLAVLSVRIAHADVKADTTKLVNAALAAINDDKAFNALLAKDAIVSTPSGDLRSTDLRWRVVPDGNIMYGFTATSLTVVETAPDQAWFHGDATARYNHGDGPNSRRPEVETLTLRVSGIASNGKLQALMFAWIGPDKALFARARKDGVTLDKPKLAGDLATAMAGWFPAALAKAQGTGTTMATGTDPKELGAGDVARKLAAIWDRLGLVVRSIDARKLGKLSFAVIELGLPVKNEKLAVPLVLGVVATADGKQWLSLSFSSSLYLARE